MLALRPSGLWGVHRPLGGSVQLRYPGELLSDRHGGHRGLVAGLLPAPRDAVGNYHNMSQVSSDETIVPTRGGRLVSTVATGWRSTSTAGLPQLPIRQRRAWNASYAGIARANSLLSDLETIDVPNKESLDRGDPRRCVRSTTTHSWISSEMFRSLVTRRVSSASTRRTFRRRRHDRRFTHSSWVSSRPFVVIYL